VTGPSLASIPLGISYSKALTPDAFLVVVTPAAAFQLPVLPVAILYSPLGNGKQAQSSITLTETTGTNQQISTPPTTIFVVMPRQSRTARVSAHYPAREIHA
jgi:hypothetical protein